MRLSRITRYGNTGSGESRRAAGRWLRARILASEAPARMASRVSWCRSRRAAARPGKTSIVNRSVSGAWPWMTTRGPRLSTRVMASNRPSAAPTKACALDPPSCGVSMSPTMATPRSGRWMTSPSLVSPPVIGYRWKHDPVVGLDSGDVSEVEPLRDVHPGGELDEPGWDEVEAIVAGHPPVGHQRREVGVHRRWPGPAARRLGVGAAAQRRVRRSQGGVDGA